MIGNDMKLDTGVGTCGKNGQSVPVGVGQPTLRLDGLTVGGTRRRPDAADTGSGRKRFGYGATPNTWQGWALTLVSCLAAVRRGAGGPGHPRQPAARGLDGAGGFRSPCW